MARDTSDISHPAPDPIPRGTLAVSQDPTGVRPLPMSGTWTAHQAEAAATARRLRTFSSFQIPVFRIYYASLLGQMAAMNMQQVAQSLLVYRLTGSAALLGTVALATSIPMLLLSLSGGVLADRLPKKQVLLVGQAASCLVPLIVGLALVTGYLSRDHTGSWWVLIVAAVVQGCVWALVMPARQSLLAEIVDREHLMNAVALNTLGMNLFRLLSPALAGFFIEFFGFSGVYFIMAGFFVVAVAFTYLLPRTVATDTGKASTVSQIREGIRYVRNDATVFLVLAITLATVILSMPYMMMLPVFTEDILKVGASGLGILISVSGIGAMVGSLILASLPNKRRGVLLLGGGLILGLALVGFSFSRYWPLSLAFMIFVGLGQTTRMALASALLMHYTPEQYRGRVMSLYMMEFGLSSFAVFLAGIMADIFGVQWSVGSLAIVLVVMSVLVLAFVPRLRRLA